MWGACDYVEDLCAPVVMMLGGDVLLMMTARNVCGVQFVEKTEEETPNRFRRVSAVGSRVIEVRAEVCHK